MSITNFFARVRSRHLCSVTFIRCYNAAVSQTQVFLSSAERAQLRRIFAGLQQLGHATLGTVRPARGALSLSGFISTLTVVLAPRVVDAVIRASATASSRSVRPRLVIPVWDFEPEAPDGSVLKAAGTLLGADVIFEALRVTDPDYPEPVAAVRKRFDRWRAAADVQQFRFSTVRIPGWTGDYVVFASPLAS